MILFKWIAALALLAATSLGTWAAGESTSPNSWDKFVACSQQQEAEEMAEGKKEIAATDKKIAEIGPQAEDSTGQVKAACQQSMQQLNVKRAAAPAELDRMGSASSAARSATKGGFASANDDVHRSHERAAASVKL